MRPSDRITPDSALQHSFVTMTHLHCQPFSKRTQESLSLMQVCYGNAHRQHAGDFTFDSKHILSLPHKVITTFSESCHYVTSNVVNTRTEASPQVNPACYQKNHIPNCRADARVAYYAAAAAAAAAFSAKPTSQLIPIPSNSSSSLPCLHQYASLSAVNEAHHLSTNVAESGKICSIIEYTPATIIISQSKPEMCMRPRQVTANHPPATYAPPLQRSLSFYDLVTAGGAGGALSLLNAVTAPAPSPFLMNNSVQTPNVQPLNVLSANTSRTNHIRQMLHHPLQSVCVQPGLNRLSSAEGDNSFVLDIASQEKRSTAYISQHDCIHLACRPKTGLCDTLCALVNQQHLYQSPTTAAAALAVAHSQQNFSNNQKYPSISFRGTQNSESNFVEDMSRGCSECRTDRPSQLVMGSLVNPRMHEVVRSDPTHTRSSVYDVNSSTAPQFLSRQESSFQSQEQQPVVANDCDIRRLSMTHSQSTNHFVSDVDCVPMNLVTNNSEPTVNNAVNLSMLPPSKCGDISLWKKMTGSSYNLSRIKRSSAAIESSSEIVNQIAHRLAQDDSFNCSLEMIPNNTSIKSECGSTGSYKSTFDVMCQPRSDKKIPVGRVQPMIKQEDSHRIHSSNRSISSPNNYISSNRESGVWELILVCLCSHHRSDSNL
ncbi:unnamed protein product [Heterobilharzia americana]|nr:unnamed protein product [Heterobilharzia americana]